MPEPNSQNTSKGKTFQLVAAEVLTRYFKIEIKPNKTVRIGEPPKRHTFDLASVDGSVFVECKNYSWTETDNVPSAKLAFLNEAALLLQQLPSGITRVIAVRYAVSIKRGISLGAYYFRTSKHLLHGVGVVEIDVTSRKVTRSFGLD